MSQTLGSLPVGAKIKDLDTKYLGVPIVWVKADSNHAGYPNNSTTLITEKIIARRAVDAKEPNNADSNRKSYGNNKYSVSNIDQWLNSDAEAGAWYSARHDADQTPDSTSVVSANPYSDKAGFMSEFSPLFRKVMLDTTLKVALNTVTDGGSYETITRKLFLASRAETFGAAENSVMEGSLLALFAANTNAVRIAYNADTAVPDGGTAGSSGFWWLRTPHSSYSCGVRLVHSDGALYDNFAYGGSGGVRPLCNLKSDTLVSDSVDDDGCYVVDWSVLPPDRIDVETPIYCNPEYNTGGIEGGKAKISWSECSVDKYVLERSINGGEFNVIYTGDSTAYTDTITDNINTVQYRVAAAKWGNQSDTYTTSATIVVQDNYPPFISGDDTALGNTATRIKYKYTVYDGDDINVTVREYVNSTLLRTYTAKGSQENTLEIGLETWNGLPTGDNTIKIVVTDDNGATATQTKHFNKIGGIIEFEYVPFGNQIAVCPKAINVQLDLIAPLDAKIQVLASNNANDTQPVWDNITTAVLSKHNHVFTNKSKEQGVSHYCVAVRVKIERNGADGAIKLYGIKCQLDCKVE
ncbi:MAG: DUF6273 domain-containing protein [Bacteroides sp.]|nr:DUF6273 domain-containing protein [Bacteroides sp.]